MSKLDRASEFAPVGSSDDRPVDSAYILDALNSVPCGLVFLDGAEKILHANTSFLRLSTQHQDAYVAGAAFAESFPNCRAPTSADIEGSDKDPQIRQSGIEITWHAHDGGGWVGMVLPFGGGSEEASLKPSKDALTGLYNREFIRYFEEKMRRDTGEIPNELGVLYVDLDRFKVVNDTLGHPIGDLLLKKVARRLKSAVRESDEIVRMGGDEFAIFARFKTTEELEDIATRIIDLIGRPYMVEGHQVNIGASVGLDTLSREESSVADVLRRADMALYNSKVNGRGCFNWFHKDMSAALDERREMEQDLRKALLLDQFEIVYQPQVSLAKNSIAGFEALLRWNHPTRGLIQPADFIPIAEETRLIEPIGKWVLEEACAAAKTWPEHVSVAVNVSPVQFEAENFVEIVQAVLKKADLPSRRLDLELSETVMLTSKGAITDRMIELHDLGVQLSLDDFGTGYSSINYLRQFPFDKLKIDQSIAREPDADENTHKIVSAVANLGSAMGMKVIAEGVETEDEMDRVREQGCSDAQGFLVSHPLPATDISDYLQKAAASADPKPSPATKKT